MKEKSLFADVDDGFIPMEGEERTHFASLKLLCEPIEAWGNERFGPCEHRSTWKYLAWNCGPVVVKAEISATSVQWRVGFGYSVSFVGVTQHGVDLDKHIPGPVLLAAEYVKLTKEMK